MLELEGKGSFIVCPSAQKSVRQKVGHFSLALGRYSTAGFSMFRDVGRIVWRRVQAGLHKFTNTLSPDYTARNLQYFRRLGCRKTAPIECAKWTMICPRHNVVGCDCDMGPAPYVKTEKNVCIGCRNPAVTYSELQPFENYACDRTWSRYLHGEVAMKPEVFGAAVVNAHEKGWISDMNMFIYAREITDMEVIVRSINAVKKRERKHRKELDYEVEFSKEMKKQLISLNFKTKEKLQEMWSNSDGKKKKLIGKIMNFEDDGS